MLSEVDLAIASWVGPAKPLGGHMFYVIPGSPNTESAGQALSVSLGKPGAYLSMSDGLLSSCLGVSCRLLSVGPDHLFVAGDPGGYCLPQTITSPWSARGSFPFQLQSGHLR